MENDLIIWMALVGVILFCLGYFAGRSSERTHIKLKNQKRATQIMHALFSDMKDDHNPNIIHINGEPHLHVEPLNPRQTLELTLEEALKNEDYLLAARLRDQLDKLDQTGGI